MVEVNSDFLGGSQNFEAAANMTNEEVKEDASAEADIND